MVNALRRYFFVMPALFTALVIYSGHVLRDSRCFFCPIPDECILGVTGTVISSPFKLAGKNQYRTKLSVISVNGTGGELSSARGTISVNIPSDYCESLLPGNLYTTGKTGFLLEEGSVVKMEGRLNKKNGIFNASSVISCTYVKSPLKKIRALSRLLFKRLMYSWGNAGGFFLALLSGSREYLEEGLSELFRATGLSHILALSGMHLSLFSGLSSRLGKRSLGKKYSFILELLALILFVWFAGRSPSLFRALLCSLLSMGFRKLKINKVSMLNILSLSFLLHVMLYPGDALNLSFKLSYGALAGILLFNELISRFLVRVFPPGISDGLGQSISAQTITAPVSVHAFGYITPAGIPASVVVSPLVTVFIYAGLVLFMLTIVFPVFHDVSFWIMNTIYGLIVRSVSFFKIIPKIVI